jgi:hypothetical protein
MHHMTGNSRAVSDDLGAATLSRICSDCLVWQNLHTKKTAFLPWSIDPEYRKTPPDDFKMTGEEHQLADLHGLDAEQIYWRRCKIADLGGSVDYFNGNTR